MIFYSFITQRHMVLFQEFSQVFSAYPMMTTREPERRELPGFYPPQHGGVADTAEFRNKADRNIFRVQLFDCF